MNFEDLLKLEAAKIATTSNGLLNEWEKEVGRVSKTLVPLSKAFIKANRGGKGIRGVLVKLGYQIAGGKEREIVKVAAAYEIFHTSILAHDDIIDQSLTRRGQPSLYQAVGGGHYGISQAICLGDAGFFLAVKIISEGNFPDKVKNEALQFFAETVLDTAVGQMLDISGGDPLIIRKLKTARYTIAGPLQIGAILAGADDNLVRELGIFGENLGIAFQIRDDILDREVKEVAKAKAEAVKYADKAQKKIAKITEDIKMRKLLKEMTKFLVERKK